MERWKMHRNLMSTTPNGGENMEQIGVRLHALDLTESGEILACIIKKKRKLHKII
jgi:hypothetical protein